MESDVTVARSVEWPFAGTTAPAPARVAVTATNDCRPAGNFPVDQQPFQEGLDSQSAFEGIGYICVCVIASFPACSKGQ